MFQLVDNLSHQAGAHALRAGVDFLYNDDTITYPRSVRGSYTFSSLANFLAGIYNNAGSRRRSATTVVSQTNPNLGVYAQDEWKVGPRLTLNAGRALRPAVSRTINTDTNNVSPRVGFAWSPSTRAAPSSAAAPASSSTACRSAPLANALLSPGNTTDSQPRSSSSVSLSPTQAGAPVFPNILARAGPAVDAGQPDDDGPDICRTRIRGRRAWRSSSRSGERSTVSVGYQYVRGVNLLMSVNQNVADLRGRRHQQRLPARIRPTRTTASIRRPASPTITACTSRSCSGRRDGPATASPTRCRSR